MCPENKRNTESTSPPNSASNNTSITSTAAYKMASNKKRNDPSTPTKPPPPVNEATSPEKKRLFTGSIDMDEEGMNNLTNSEAAAREERLRACEARKTRIEEQKRTGKKVKEKSPASASTKNGGTST